MRKAQKQQAEDFLRTLALAHDEWKRLVEKNNASALEAARKILEDCQQGAIELGNMIEAAEGEGFPTISLLEAYCELTYQVHEALSGGIACDMTEQQEKQIAAGEEERKVQDKVRGAVSSKRTAKTYKDLRKLLIQIENSVKHDIKVRTEAVFLPYKASMWDSLESVWRAAAEDESCDVYVIPIPYYDKNPDGSFREMHYEGHLYPDYVPVVWYENYDFANRQPDMIFIHNPYDNSNYVTSVHPFFYAQNLKQYTERLIYIPYFILDEIQPENDAAVGEMKHFCTTPAVIHADRVIVQSDDMRQIYINVMMEYTGNQDASRKYWEDKILGIGSPKVDKILYTRKEELKIPERWLKMIQRPDGSWKKIIFYNTSINGLLQHNEQMLIKMQDTFRIFYENRNEVALLWRPHPLMESTLTSMRPQLWETYQKIRDQFIAEGWGIYDDTSDVDRAVIMSDAYYGDWSSVVELCRKAGKMIMRQNPQILGRANDEPVCLWTGGGFEVCDDRVWFVPHWANVLCCFHLKTRLLEKMIFFPELATASAGFFQIKRMGDTLVIIPAFEDTLYLYDMYAGEMHSIILQPGLHSCEKFQECVEWKGILYLFPYDYGAIVKLDMTGKDGTMIALSKKEQKFCDSCVMEDTVYLVNRTNQLFAFDLSAEQFRVYEADGEKCFRTVCVKDQMTLLITDEDSALYLFDVREHSFDKKPQKYIPANQSIVIANQLYLFPLRDNYEIVKVDMEHWSAREIAMTDKAFYKPWSSVATSRITQVDDKIYFMNPNHQCIYEVDRKTDEMNSYHCIVDSWSDEQCDYFHRLSQKQGVYQEGNERFTSLAYFIAKTSNCGRRESAYPCEAETLGERLYKKMKE